MTKRAYWLLLLPLFVFLSMKDIEGADVSVGQREAMKAIAEQYLANRESFRVFSCHYARYRVVVDSLEEALKGSYKEKNFHFGGKWYVSNDYVRLEQTCDPLVFADVKKSLDNLQVRKDDQTNRETSGAKTISIPCTNRLIIRNNNNGLELSYSELLTCATLSPVKEQNLDSNIESTPFDFGVMGANEVMSPYRCISDCLNGQFTGQYEGAQSVHGMVLEVITLFPENGKFEHKYGFDPKSGFLPRYVSIKSPNDVILEAVMIDVKEFPDGRWFPIEVVSLTKLPGRIAGGYYKVEDISVDRKIPDDVFLINIPKNATVTVANVDDQWAKLDEEMTVGPETLEDLRTFCKNFARAYNEERMPFAIEQSAFTYTKLRVLSIIIGIAMVVYGLYLMIKKLMIKE